MQLIADTLSNYVRFEVPDGEATFSIHLIDQIQFGAWVVVYFEDEHLDELVAKLQA